MKKIIFTLLIACTAVLSTYAGDKLEVISGSIAEMKNGGTASVELDMQNTTYDHQYPIREDYRYTRIDVLLPDFTSEFIREFNENSKKFRLSIDGEQQYQIKVIVDDLDMHVNVMSFKGSIATELEGTIEIYKGEESVAKLKFYHESSGFNTNISLEETFEGLAKNLAKKINKGK